MTSNENPEGSDVNLGLDNTVNILQGMQKFLAEDNEDQDFKSGSLVVFFRIQVIVI